MSTLTFPHADAFSSGEIPTLLPERTIDIEHKHRLVSEFLQARRFDALLLQQPSNFSWFTSGTSNCRGGSSEIVAALFITPDSRVVVTNNVDSGQFFEKELPGLGFQLKERPWHEPRQMLIDDLCRGRMVASDTGFGRTRDVSMHLTDLRLPLTSLECERIRELGKQVAHAVEATARHAERGQTEAELAGQLAHRLVKHQIHPERLQVASDGCSHRYRHWSYGTDPVQKSVVISAVGRRWGLCAGASRTVSFGPPAESVQKAHRQTMLMQATGLYFSRPDWELFETWSRVQRIYEKFGCANEWQLADQAELMGYNIVERPIVPQSGFQLASQMAVHWHPSVGPACAGDTVLVTPRGFELLTPMEQWPSLYIEVKGTRIPRPDILVRPRNGSGSSTPGESGDSILLLNGHSG